MSSTDKEIKRGSRPWFYQKLKAIKALGGEDARHQAIAIWRKSYPYGARDLEHFERVLKLRVTSKRIKDRDAFAAIIKIIQEDDQQQLIEIEKLLSEKVIEASINAQGMDEDFIRDKAKRWSLLTKRTELSMRRRFRMEVKQGTARINMTLGLVGEDGHHHATPHELDLRNQQKKRWQEFGKSTTLTRGDESINMLDVMKSVGEKKLAETLTLTKGIENYAKTEGLTWTFITLTAPPKMHPNPANGKSSWDGTTPDQAHEWIEYAAGKVVKRLQKKGITISGLRVVESHMDGCPHWHLLVFAPLDQMHIIEAEYRWQPEWKSEPGMTFMLNDGTASAVSYVFKYLTKTINSVEMIEGEAGFVDAWRSTWGIRAFAFFGIPPVSLWRNFRAVKECPDEPLLAAMWRAANSGDGHAFIMLNGGLNVARKDRPVTSKTTSDKYDKTKTIEFILQDTTKSIKFNFEKWQQSKVIERKPNKNAMVEVIPNYPRRSKAESKPIEFASGRQGNDSLDPIERGRTPHSRLPSPSILPHLSHVGMARNHHGTDALVGALQPRNRPANWWDEVDMSKAPSLTRFNETRKKTGQAIYSD